MSEPVKFYMGVFVVALVIVGIFYSAWNDHEDN